MKLTDVFILLKSFGLFGDTSPSGWSGWEAGVRPYLTVTLGSWVTPQVMKALVPLMTLWSCGGVVIRVRAEEQKGGKEKSERSNGEKTKTKPSPAVRGRFPAQSHTLTPHHEVGRCLVDAPGVARHAGVGPGV